MECLEFRRRLGSEPHARTADMRAHRQQCAACTAAWQRAQGFEQALHAALVDVPIPDGLIDGILLAQATNARRQHVSRRRFAFAVAASVLLAVAAGGLLWQRHDARSLPALAVAHMPGEMHSLDLTQPVDARTVAADFRARGVSLKGPLPTGTTYVHQCIVGPYKAVHLVSRAGDESVAVLYLPGKHVSASRNFRRGDWQGREVPLNDGTLVMLTDQGSRRPFNAIEQNWRVAIDGLGGQRVTQL